VKNPGESDDTPFFAAGVSADDRGFMQLGCLRGCHLDHLRVSVESADHYEFSSSRVDGAKNRLSISRGALAPGSYRDLHEPGASAPRLMNNPG